jgi:hypothetical protein
VEPRAGLDAVVRRKILPGLEDPPIIQRIAQRCTTELSRPFEE